MSEGIFSCVEDSRCEYFTLSWQHPSPHSQLTPLDSDHEPGSLRSRATIEITIRVRKESHGIASNDGAHSSER